MGLFDRFRRSAPERVIEDPILGHLEYSDTGCWRGDVFFEPTGDDLGMELISTGSDPTEEQKQTFVRLSEDYVSLLDSIGPSLIELCAANAEACAEKGVATPRSSEEMLALTQLNWVEIGRGGELRLGYGFREVVGWDDAVLTLRVKGWKASGESLDV